MINYWDATVWTDVNCFMLSGVRHKLLHTSWFCYLRDNLEKAKLWRHTDQWLTGAETGGGEWLPRGMKGFLRW